MNNQKQYYGMSCSKDRECTLDLSIFYKLPIEYCFSWPQATGRSCIPWILPYILPSHLMGALWVSSLNTPVSDKQVKADAGRWYNQTLSTYASLMSTVDLCVLWLGITSTSIFLTYSMKSIFKTWKMSLILRQSRRLRKSHKILFLPSY